MSVWSRIIEALSALASGESLSRLFDGRDGEGRSRAPERSVAFTIAVIALSAKMAKADGLVTRSEVAAFRQVFVIPVQEEANAARVFNLARQDVTGFDAYARRIARMFGDDNPVLHDLMEGLFHIALADGGYHPAEDVFLAQVASIFGIGDRAFRALRSRFVPDAPADPHAVLGIDLDASPAEARAAWRQAVLDCHPDRLRARGVPDEALALAEARLIAVNAAWAQFAQATLHDAPPGAAPAGGKPDRDAPDRDAPDRDAPNRDAPNRDDPEHHA